MLLAQKRREKEKAMWYFSALVSKRLHSDDTATHKLHLPRVYLSLEASSGIPRHISRSNLPARLKAGSKASGRLVAPMTRTRAVMAMVFRSGKKQTQGEQRTRHWGWRTTALP